MFEVRGPKKALLWQAVISTVGSDAETDPYNFKCIGIGQLGSIPLPSMYGMFTYIWLIFIGLIFRLFVVQVG